MRVTAAAAVLAVAAGVVALVAGDRRPAHPPAPAPPAPQAPPLPGYGVNVNRLFNDNAYTPAQIDAQLAAVRSTGATVARSDAFWEASEPLAPEGGVHRWQWSFDDQIAGALARHGLRWLAILDYSAPWAQSILGDDHSPPARAGDFAAYAAAFAARYGARGTFWRAHPSPAAEAVDTFEVWNEPDNAPFWHPVPEPAAYADLYLVARRAILAVDPTARVIVGGLSRPSRFLPAMVQARPDLRGQVDGVAIHAYAPTPDGVLRSVADARSTLRALGMGAVPLYVTEFGWTTSPARALNWAPGPLRPRYITDTFAALGHLNCGVAAALLYTWVTPQRNPLDREDWYGIARPGGGATADTAALAAGIAAARAAGPAVPLCG